MGNLEKNTIIVIIGGFLLTIHGLPMVYDDYTDYGAQNDNNASNDTNKTQELLIVRAVVYEVGILANVSSSEEDDSDSNEEVDLSFFRPHHNGSVIDLSNIPVPIQTNISSQVITGIAPLNFGQILAPAANVSADAPLVALSTNNQSVIPVVIPNAVVSVKTNYSTTDIADQQNLLSSLKPLLNKN